MRIYLDNNATTALDPKVFKAMLKEFSGPPANPSSTHWFGREAKRKLNLARESIASFFQAKPDEIIFTSGGTESINMVLRSIPKGSHIITTSIEHSAVHNTIEDLEKKGYPITRIPVGLWGAPLIEKIEEAIQDNTKALVFTLSNAETGVKIDIEKIATLAHKKNIPLFLDAVSFIGKEKLIHHLGITAMALSAHKFHGPKGIGALFVRSSYKISPLILGGAQEKQRRAGTENLAGICGLAEALQIVSVTQDEITTHIQSLRDHFELTLLRELEDVAINGEGLRIVNTSNLTFMGVDGETLLMHLDMAGIGASHGSACTSGAIEPSRVLLNMGIDRKTAKSSIRFSLSRENTKEEIDQALEKIISIIKQLRKIYQKPSQ